MTHKYATPTGEMDPASVRARAVGYAVFLEHAGGCGDIFAWGARDKDAAEAIAGELTAVLDGLRERYDDAIAQIRMALAGLDSLAELWGDEGVFRRCRDRLRAIPGVKS